jgi:hypothetical protein
MDSPRPPGRCPSQDQRLMENGHSRPFYSRPRTNPITDSASGANPAQAGAPWSEVIPRLVAAYPGSTLWDWLTYPGPWLSAFAEMVPVLEAERALLASTIAHLPHMTAPAQRGKHRQILNQWTDTSRSRPGRNRRPGIRVNRTPAEHSAWFAATHAGRKLEAGGSNE